MNEAQIQEAESVTRSIARWGSIVAAIIFAVAFVTDRRLSWELVAGQALQIALVVSIFVGYGLALTERFEVLGSVIALAAIVVICVLCWVKAAFLPSPFFLAVGLPALFHLGAIALHRSAAQADHRSESGE